MIPSLLASEIVRTGEDLGLGGMHVESDTIRIYLLEPSYSLALELSLIYHGRGE